MNRLEQAVFDGLVGATDHNLERRDHVADHVFGRIMEQQCKPKPAIASAVATPRVDARLRLAALLHDAPEYVIGDMISPFKAVLGGDYKGVEKRLLAAIHIRFGLPPDLADEITQAIKAADRGAAYLEATELAGFSHAEAKRLFGRDPGLPAAMQQDYLTPWTAARAEKRFLARFAALHAS